MVTSPKICRFIALGPSATEAPPHTRGDGVEVWGIQYTWQHFTVDRAFVMDDREWIINKNSSFDIPVDIASDMRRANIPIYVAHKWPDVPNTVEYPIEEIKKAFPKHYFMDSMAYMFALAIQEGFERIETYGIDFRYFTDLGEELKYNHNWLDETHCGAFWAGVAIGKGIEVTTTNRCSMMKPVKPGETSLYGYEVSATIKAQRDKILKDRKKVSNSEPVVVFRPPEGVDPKEFLKQITVGSIKPSFYGTAKVWDNMEKPQGTNTLASLESPVI